MVPRLRYYLAAALTALLVTLGVGVLVLPSASASSGVAGEISYYNANYGGSFYESPTTIEEDVYGIHQTIESDGSINLTAGPFSQYTDSGFSIYHGTLGDLKSMLVQGAGPFRVNLWLDAGGDGSFFNWGTTVSGSVYMTGLNGDLYLLGDSGPTGGTLVINGGSSFNLQGGGGGTYTLAQLQQGALSGSGVTSSTDVAIWVGIVGSTSGSDASATIQTVQFGPPQAVAVTTQCAAQPDGTSVSLGGGTYYCGYDAFPTIQQGVDAVAAGGTVEMAAGTYTEQVAIDKALTLNGAGEDRTFIDLPASPTTVSTQIGSFSTRQTVYGVAVTGASGVTISNLTLDGESATNAINGCSGDHLAGVAFQDASGAVNSVDLKDWAPQSGVGCGTALGLQVEASSGASDVTVSDTTVIGYGKAGIFAGGPGATLTATGDTVVGAPISSVATNGIEVDYGAAGKISGNTVSGNDFTRTPNATDPQADYAAGVLLYGDGPSPVSVSDNTLTDNQIGVETVGTDATVSGNAISETGSGIPNSIAVYAVPCDTYCTGLVKPGASSVTIENNDISGIPWSYGHASNPTAASAGIWAGNTSTAGATGSMTATISNNSVIGGFFGVMVAPNSAGATATITGNQVSGFERTGIDAGSFAMGGDGITATIDGNTVTGPGSGNKDPWALNGIEIANGATGSVTDNHVSGIVYTGASATEASAVTVFESSGVQVQGNTLTDDQLGVAVQTAGYSSDSSNWAMTGDTVSGNAIGFDGSYQAPGVLSGESAGTVGIWVASYKAAASVDAAIQGNTLNGAGSEAGSIPATGILVGDTAAGGAAGAVTATVSGNAITGWTTGVADLGTTSGAFTSTVNYNDLSGNSAAGLENLTGAPSGTSAVTGLDATDNWWGSANGPASPANTYNTSHQGTAVTGSATFVPWLKSAPALGASSGQEFAPVTDGSHGYSSIQAALDGAASGDTITAAPGTYTEAVSIPTSVDLQGAHQGVDARLQSGDSVSTVDGGFAIHASDVTIDGFTIQHAATTAPTYGVGVNIYADTSGAQIVNDIVQDNVFGLYLGSNGADKTLIQHDVFKDNNQTGSASGDGIYSDRTASNVLIDSSDFTGNSSYGIVLVGSGTGTATSNEKDITISHSTFSGSTALALMGVANANLSDNFVQDTGTATNTDAIYLGGGDYGVTITHNVVQNSTGWAVNLQHIYNTSPSSQVTMTANSLDKTNYLGGLNVADGAYATGDNVNAADNWWGTKGGPASMTQGAVDATPWIASLTISPSVVRSEVNQALSWNASMEDQTGSAIADSAFSATFTATGSAGCQSPTATGPEALTSGAVSYGCTPTTLGNVTLTGAVSLDGHPVTLAGTATAAIVPPPASGGVGGGAPTGTGIDGNLSSNVTVNGTTTAIDVSGDLLLQSLGTQTGQTVTFTSSTTTLDLSIPGSALTALEQGSDDLSLETPGATYTLPAGSLDLSQLASLLGAPSPSDISLNITVTPASAADTGDITQGLLNGSILGAPVTFTVTATYNGQTQTVEVFTGPVPRSFDLGSAPDPNDTTGIVIVNGVPEHAWTVFSGNTATIYSHTDSTYAVVQNQVSFQDIAGLPQAAAINALANKLVIAGMTPTTFDPQGGVTRAQFAALVIRALGLWNLGSSLRFPDVPQDSWASPVIRSAVAESFIKGYPDGTFRPQLQITNAQMAVIVGRVMRFLSIGQGQVAVTPTDQAKIPGWAAQDVALALSQGIMTTGSDGAFQPYATTTRAQAAQIIWNLMQKAGIE